MTADNEPQSTDEQENGPWREMLLLLIPALALIAGAFWLAFQFVDPAPPKRVVITTGSESGAYYAYAQRYAQILKRSGIVLDVRSSKGSVENLERIRNAGNGVHLAMLQGGIADQKSAPELVSVGRMFLEPLWIFHRRDIKVERLGDLREKRIAIGPVGSGTRKLAEALLGRNEIVEGRAILLPLGGQEAVDALSKGDVDAIFLSMAPEAPLLQGLLRSDAVKLMSFAQAEAYTRIFPYLSRIVLPQGVVDLKANIPNEDVVLLAAQAALVAREDLHPAIVSLMVEAANEVHGGGGMFQRPSEFPRTVDPEFQMSDDAMRTYKSGQPFLRRFLPFWLAVLLERLIVLALPLATVAIPLFKVLPLVYQWRIRQRILRWYAALKKLEARLNADPAMVGEAAYRAEINRIEAAANHIPIPVRFSDQLYDLRSAIDLVRRRIDARALV